VARANEAAGCRPALLPRQKIRVFRRNRDCFPVEGSVLDLWKTDRSHVSSRRDKFADGAGCDILFRGHRPQPDHRIGFEPRSTIFTAKQRGVDVTVAEGCELPGPETGNATVIVESDGGMIPLQSVAPDVTLPQGETSRFSDTARLSKNNCMSMASRHAHHAWASWRQAMTCAGATVKVVRHADR